MFIDKNNKKSTIKGEAYTVFTLSQELLFKSFPIIMRIIYKNPNNTILGQVETSKLDHPKIWEVVVMGSGVGLRGLRLIKSPY